MWCHLFPSAFGTLSVYFYKFFFSPESNKVLEGQHLEACVLFFYFIYSVFISLSFLSFSTRLQHSRPRIGQGIVSHISCSRLISLLSFSPINICDWAFWTDFSSKNGERNWSVNWMTFTPQVSDLHPAFRYEEEFSATHTDTQWHTDMLVLAIYEDSP